MDGVAQRLVYADIWADYKATVNEQLMLSSLWAAVCHPSSFDFIFR